MTLTLSAPNLKSFIKHSCSGFLAKAYKCHFQDALDEWKISNKNFLLPSKIVSGKGKYFGRNLF
jgi:hypothetical protein